MKRIKAGGEKKKKKAEADKKKKKRVQEEVEADKVRAEELELHKLVAAKQAATDRAENASEAHRAAQRSTFHGARVFIGSPTVMTPIAEIQLALVQLEAACAFEEGATAAVRAARCEWRDNVRGGATLALGGAAPFVVVGVAAEVANPIGTYVRSGAVYSSDVSGGDEPTFAPMRTGVVFDVDHAWDGAPQPSAPPAPVGAENSAELLRAPRDSHLNDGSFASLAAAYGDVQFQDYGEPHGANKNKNANRHHATELAAMAPMTTAPTSYCAVSVVELRTQLLKLEAAMTVNRQKSEWSMHSHFLRKKWSRYVASDDVKRDVGEDKLVSRLASGLLMLDRSLEERVPMARKHELVWRDQIVNQGDVVCVWAARRAWRQRLEGLGGSSRALEWDAGPPPPVVVRSAPTARSGGGGYSSSSGGGSASRANMSRTIAKVCRNCSFGSARDECAICRKWVGSNKETGKLCNSHQFGQDHLTCCKCGKKEFEGSCAPAKLCSSCSFGSSGSKCVLCRTPWGR